MSHKLYMPLLLLLLSALACNILNPAPATSALPPTPSLPGPTATPSPSPLPSGSGPCQAAIFGEVTAYTRPSFEDDVFSTSLPATLEITSRSADGWFGFDPQKAQAANIGVFRLRWIPPEAAITLTGDCAGLPIAAWVPEPGVCYEMVMEPVEVHASANPTSPVTATLNVGDFAAVLGRTGTGWLFVNGDQANAPGVKGFIPELEMNGNGPCDSIPTVP